MKPAEFRFLTVRALDRKTIIKDQLSRNASMAVGIPSINEGLGLSLSIDRDQEQLEKNPIDVTHNDGTGTVSIDKKKGN